MKPYKKSIKKISTKIAMFILACGFVLSGILGVMFNDVLPYNPATDLKHTEEAAVKARNEYDFKGVLDNDVGQGMTLDLTQNVNESKRMGAARLNGTTRTYNLRAGQVISDVIVATANCYFWDPMPSQDIMSIFAQYSPAAEQRFKFYSRVVGKTESVLRYADPENESNPWFEITFIFNVVNNERTHSTDLGKASPINNTTLTNRQYNGYSTDFTFSVSDIAVNQTGTTGSLKIMAASVFYPGAVDASALASNDMGVNISLTPESGVGQTYYERLNITLRNSYYQAFGVEFLVKNIDPKVNSIGIVNCYVGLTNTNIAQSIPESVEKRTTVTTFSSQNTYSNSMYAPSPKYPTYDYSASGHIINDKTAKTYGTENFYHKLSLNPSAGTLKTGLHNDYTMSSIRQDEPIGFDVVMQENLQYDQNKSADTAVCLTHGAVITYTGSLSTIHINNYIFCKPKQVSATDYMCTHYYVGKASEFVTNSNPAYGDVSATATLFKHVYNGTTTCMATTKVADTIYKCDAHSFSYNGNTAGAMTHLKADICYYSNYVPGVPNPRYHNWNSVPFYFAVKQGGADLPTIMTSNFAGGATPSSLMVTSPATRYLYTLTAAGVSDLNSPKYSAIYGADPKSTLNLTNTTLVPKANETADTYSEIENIYAFDKAFMSVRLFKKKSLSFISVRGMLNTPTGKNTYIVLTICNTINGKKYRTLKSIAVTISGCPNGSNDKAFESVNSVPREAEETLSTIEKDRIRTFIGVRGDIKTLNAGYTYSNSIAVDDDQEDFQFAPTGTLIFDDPDGATSSVAAATFEYTRIVTPSTDPLFALQTNRVQIRAIKLTPKRTFYVAVEDARGGVGFIPINVTITNIPPRFTTELVDIKLEPSDSYGVKLGTGILEKKDPSRYEINPAIKPAGNIEVNNMWGVGEDDDIFTVGGLPQSDLLTIDVFDWDATLDAYLTKTPINTIGTRGCTRLRISAKKRTTEPLTLKLRLSDGYDTVESSIQITVENSVVSSNRVVNNARFVGAAGFSQVFDGNNLGVDFDNDAIAIVAARIDATSANLGLPSYIATSGANGYIRVSVSSGLLTITAVAKSTKHALYDIDDNPNIIGDFGIQVLLRDAGDPLYANGDPDLSAPINKGTWVTIDCKVTNSDPTAINTSISGFSGESVLLYPYDLAADEDFHEMAFNVGTSNYADRLHIYGILSGGSDLGNVAAGTNFVTIDFVKVSADGLTITPTTESNRDCDAVRITFNRWTYGTKTLRLWVKDDIGKADINVVHVAVTVTITVMNSKPQYRPQGERYEGVGSALNPIVLNMAVKDVAYDSSLKYADFNRPVYSSLVSAENRLNYYPSKLIFSPYDFIYDPDLQASLQAVIPNIDSNSGAPLGFESRMDELKFTTSTTFYNNINGSISSAFVDYRGIGSDGYLISLTTGGLGQTRNIEQIAPVQFSIKVVDRSGEILILNFLIIVHNSRPVLNTEAAFGHDYVDNYNQTQHNDALLLQVDPDEGSGLNNTAQLLPNKKNYSTEIFDPTTYNINLGKDYDPGDNEALEFYEDAQHKIAVVKNKDAYNRYVSLGRTKDDPSISSKTGSDLQSAADQLEEAHLKNDASDYVSAQLLTRQYYHQINPGEVVYYTQLVLEIQAHKSTRFLADDFGTVWVGFFMTDKTSFDGDKIYDSVSNTLVNHAATCVEFCNHISEIMWIEVKVLNSEVYQTEESKSIQINREITALKPYQIMLRPDDGVTRASDTVTHYYRDAGQNILSKPFTIGNEEAPLIILAKDPDLEDIVMRKYTGSDGTIYGFRHANENPGMFTAKLYFDADNDLTKGKEWTPYEDTVDYKNWYIIIEFISLGNGGLDLYLADIPSTRDPSELENSANIKNFRVNFIVKNLKLLNKYKGDYITGQVGLDYTIEYNANVYSRANPTIPVVSNNGRDLAALQAASYKLDLFDIIAHQYDPNGTADGQNAFLSFAENRDQPTLSEYSWVTLTDDTSRLRARGTSVTINRNDQKYIQILGSSNYDRNGNSPSYMNSNAIYPHFSRYVYLRGLQRTKEPIELTFNLLLSQNGQSFEYYGSKSGADIEPFPNVIPKFDDPEQKDVYNNNYKPYFFNVTIKVNVANAVITNQTTEDANKAKGNEIFASSSASAEKGYESAVYGSNRELVGHYRGLLNGVTSSTSRAVITTQTVANQSGIETSLPIIDDDYYDFKNISFSSIYAGNIDPTTNNTAPLVMAKTDETAFITQNAAVPGTIYNGKYVYEYNNLGVHCAEYHTKVNLAGVGNIANDISCAKCKYDSGTMKYGNGHAFTEFFTLSKPVTSNGTQYLYVKGVSRTDILVNNYFPLFFMVYDDFEKTSEAISDYDIISGDNITAEYDTMYDGPGTTGKTKKAIVSRAIVCVYVRVNNSPPVAKRTVINSSASMGSASVSYLLSDLFSDSDMVMKTEADNRVYFDIDVDPLTSVQDYIDLIKWSEPSYKVGNETIVSSDYITVAPLNPKDGATDSDRYVYNYRRDHFNAADAGKNYYNYNYGSQQVIFNVHKPVDTDKKLTQETRLRQFNIEFRDSMGATAQVLFQIYITNNAPVQYGTLIKDESIYKTGVYYRELSLTVGTSLEFDASINTETFDNEIQDNFKGAIKTSTDFETPQSEMKIDDLADGTAVNTFVRRYSDYGQITKYGTDEKKFHFLAEKATPSGKPIVFFFTVNDGESEYATTVCTYYITIKSKPPELAKTTDGVYVADIIKTVSLNAPSGGNAGNLTVYNTDVVSDNDPGEVLSIVSKPKAGSTVFRNGLIVSSVFTGAADFAISFEGMTKFVNYSSNDYISIDRIQSPEGIMVKALNLYKQNAAFSNIDPIFYIRYYVADIAFNAVEVTLKVMIIADEIKLKDQYAESTGRTNIKLNSLGTSEDNGGIFKRLDLRDFVKGSDSGSTADRDFSYSNTEYRIEVSEVVNTQTSNLIAEYLPTTTKYKYLTKKEETAYYKYFDILESNGIEGGKYLTFVSKMRTLTAISINITIQKNRWVLNKTDNRPEYQSGAVLTLRLAFQVENSTATPNEDNIMSFTQSNGEHNVVSGVRMHVNESVVLPIYGTGSLAYLMTDPDGDAMRLSENVSGDWLVRDDTLNGDFKKALEISLDTNGFLTITCLNKLENIDRNDYNLDFKGFVSRVIVITFRDELGNKSVPLELPVTILNSKPQVNDEFDTNFTVRNGEVYTMEIDGRVREQIGIEQLISDADMGKPFEKFTLSESISQAGTPAGLNVREDTASVNKETIVNIKAIFDNNGSFLAFEFVGKSFKRGAKSAPLMFQIRDSSGELTENITFIFTVGNNAPVAVTEPMPTIDIIVEYGIVERFVFLNEDDHNNYYKNTENAPPFIQLFTDINTADRFCYNNLYSDLEYDDLDNVIAVLDYNGTINKKGFFIRTDAEKRGTQYVHLTCYDSDPMVSANGALKATVTIRINVSDHPNMLKQKSVSIYRKHKKEFSPGDVYEGVNENYAFINGTFRKAGIAEGVDDPYEAFTPKVNIYNGQVIEGENEGTITIKVDLTIGIYTFTVQFELTVTPNNEPKFNPVRNGVIRTSKERLDILTTQLIKQNNKYGDYYYSETLSIRDLFFDPEEDLIKFVSITSNQNRIAEPVQLDEMNFEIVCKARGTTVFNIVVEDAVGEHNYKVTYVNEDLDALSFFSLMLISVQDNPIQYVVAVGIVAVLFIVLIAVLRARKKKKELQLELERQLINEMELEEQLLKLSAANPELFADFGLLAPGDDDPIALMLRQSMEIAQNVHNGMMLDGTAPQANPAIEGATYDANLGIESGAEKRNDLQLGEGQGSNFDPEDPNTWNF